MTFTFLKEFLINILLLRSGNLNQQPVPETFQLDPINGHLEPYFLIQSRKIPQREVPHQRYKRRVVYLYQGREIQKSQITERMKTADLIDIIIETTAIRCRTGAALRPKITV